MDSDIAPSAMEVSNPPRYPAPSTPTPLQHISPNRIHEPRLPQSPSLHSYLNENDHPKHRDSMTDVQSRVSFLNSLSNPSSPTRQPRFPTTPARRTAIHDAAMNYEESQATIASLTADLERARQELGTAQKRERKVAERVEALMEQLDRQGEKRKADHKKYLEEMKRAERELRRAQQSQIEADQNAQGERVKVKKLVAEVEHERGEKEKARQEAFERAYALAGMVEEMQALRNQLKVVERERDAATHEARSAVMIPVTEVRAEQPQTERLPQGSESRDMMAEAKSIVRSADPMDQDVDSDIGRPHSYQPLGPFEALKLKGAYMDKQIVGEPISVEEELAHLKQELYYVKRQRKEDQEVIHFMQMECQFKACACRRAEEKGERFVHDRAYDAQLQEQRASKKRKISPEESAHDVGASLAAPTGPCIESMPDADNQEIPKPSRSEVPTEPAQPPRSPTTADTSDVATSPTLLAADIPLPPMEQMEIDALDHTPEPTAQLEDITQVIVEPGTVREPFLFSTSTHTRPWTSTSTTAPPSLVRAESAMARASLTQGLFDMSPPKQAHPPRPSTSMGVLTVESPIRLVPDSPRVPLTIDAPEATTPEYQEPFVETTTTTKVALKNSPERSAHRRAQSRPNLRTQSPLAHVTSAGHDASGRETSASPAASTIFPVTPLHKHSRSMHNLHQAASATTTTTTTRVPLRDANGADDIDARSIPRPRTSQSVRSSRIQREYDGDRDAENATEMIRPISSLSQHTEPVRQPAAGESILANVPGTPISREAALAQIRARRDRARSMNLKKDGERSPVKVKTAGLFSKDAARRDISQASAPGRVGG